MEINLGSFIFQILAFGILFLLLRKFAFGPLLSVMEKRQKQIEDQINSAESNKVEAEKLLEEQKKSLQEARVEARDIIENAKASSVKQANDIIESSRKEAEQMKDRALKEITLEKEKALAELKEQVSALSVLIASKIIEKELDAKTQSKLIDDVMKQVGDSL